MGMPQMNGMEYPQMGMPQQMPMNNVPQMGMPQQMPNVRNYGAVSIGNCLTMLF